MKKNILFVLYMLLIWAVVTLGFSLFIPNQPLNGAGDCGSNYLAKDETDPFEYDGEQLVCKAIIKAGSQVQGEACFSLTIANPNDGCYAATGLGTNSVRVRKVEGDECKGISHVEFYPCPQDEPTNTSTSTNTPTATVTKTATVTSTSTVPVDNTETPTATLETPFKFWTPTPITATPTETDWNIGRTVTVSPTPFETSTPTNTLPLSEKKTPEILLPETGADGSIDRDEIELRFGIAFVLSVIGLFVLRHIWRILHE